MRARLTCAMGVVCLMANAALAQPGGNLDLQAFRPAIDSRGLITVNASEVLQHRELSFGLVTNWGKGVLRFDGAGNSFYEVENILTPTLIGAMGLRLGKAELELGVSIPFAIMSGDRGPDSDGGTPGDPRDDQQFRFEGQGLGNVALHSKLRLLNTSRSPIGLALIGSIQLPTASQSGSWISDDGVGAQATLVLDREMGRFKVAANLGVRVRSGETSFRDDTPMTMGMPLTDETISVGTSIPFGAGMSWAITEGKLDLVGEVFGDVPLSGRGYLPLEALGGLKVYLAKNSYLLLGGGVGLVRGAGGNPDARAFVGIVFEPRNGDRDGDGLKDDVDKCPNNPEDFDDFEDEDGCPELDNDLDRIPDKTDRCPNEPEDRDGDQDEDGCPEKTKHDRDGDGILDKDDDCPDNPEDIDKFEDSDGCPDTDNDKDQIPDVDDVCPDDPEDKDQFKDSDGCPDLDNDEDRVPDTQDKCPGRDGEDLATTKETWNTHKDDDGCPDRGDVDVGTGVLYVLKKIYFEYDSAVIKKRSYKILNVVAKTIQLNPDLLLIEVQGHTDERGSDAYNLKLSQARAQSVVAFLSKAGVQRSRLKPKGYGERKPIDRRRNQQAWAKNRRVEFIIKRRAE